jgi:hypothetical protein
MPRCSVCFVSDDRALFPTLLAAIQARAQLPEAAADVILFAIDPGQRAATTFGRICAAENIGFRSVAAATLGGAGGASMVAAVGGSVGMYARLFLDRFVPDEYDQILYLDGDVQIRRPLAPLVQAVVAPGRFLAARDPMTFVTDEPGPEGEPVRRYMDGLGLRPDQRGRYFNSGVLRINRHGWARIGQDAFAFLRAQGERCRFHDQSALNAVAAGQHDALSFRWNFPIFFRNCGVEPAIAPVVYHFMSSPKPWQGNFPPWNAEAVTPYRALLRQYPQLDAYRTSFSLLRTGRYLLQQRLKKVTELAAWRFSSRRARILTSEQATVPI